MLATSKTTKQNGNFLVYIHQFRGFAILNIVAIHAIAFAIYTCRIDVSKSHDNVLQILNEILFHNSTIYFAVISGILFSSVLKQKGYKRFYLSKLNFVIIPYLILTTLFSILKPYSYVLHTYENTTDYINSVLENLILGKAQFTFWYIPVLLFLYLITPILDYVVSNKKWNKWLCLIIVLIPLFISRVQLSELLKMNTPSLATMLYFSGAYMAGICFGSQAKKWISIIKNYFKPILFITISISLILIYFELFPIEKIGFWSVKSSLYYIQKIGLSALFLILFKKLEKSQQPKWLNIIADYSFSIYFLHAFFIIISYKLLAPIINITSFKPLFVLLFGLVYLLISIGFSILITILIKKLFGKYSRMLIGS